MNMKIYLKRLLVEARESGIAVGLFDESGDRKEGVLDTVLPDTNRIMWEAPLKLQQIFAAEIRVRRAFGEYSTKRCSCF